MEILKVENLVKTYGAVSYTHLDVYKRQIYFCKDRSAY